MKCLTCGVRPVEKESRVSSGRKKLERREHAGRNALPDHLPRREEIIAVEGEELLCVWCGEQRCRIGYEKKEVLDMEPARYFVRMIKREKLACHKSPEGGVVTAGAGGAGSWTRASSPTLWSSMCSSKNTSPICRSTGRPPICKEITGSNFRAARSMLLPVAAVLKRDLLEGGYIQADETPIGV